MLKKWKGMKQPLYWYLVKNRLVQWFVQVILNVITPYIENPNVTFFSDYKSSLQEFVQTEQKSLEYVLVNETGPAHDKRFTVEVKIDEIVYGSGTAPSKKEAEQEAAKEALDKLAIKNN